MSFAPPNLIPRSLATRTALVLLLGLAVVQGAGLTIHAWDRIALQRRAEMRDLRQRVLSIYRTVVVVAPGAREGVLKELELPADTAVSLEAAAPADNLPLLALPAENPWRGSGPGMRGGAFRPREIVVRGGPAQSRSVVGLRLPDGPWLIVRAQHAPPRFWHAPAFLAAFALMTVTAALLTLWAVRRLTAPVRTLAAAAEALGRNVNAPPLPETGPTEIATAAVAFNTMAGRIRKFVQDRTDLLTAIGHDLRTPITRLKLRAEFVEDAEQRRKMLVDLNELEAMVAATLAFGRDSTATEPLRALDLAELCRTLLDEVTDIWPDNVAAFAYSGPDHLAVSARPLALKRALANLVTNAATYGASARINLAPSQSGSVTLTIEDDGPGIPPGELERVFEPFHRLEASRNRETGGSGLGLPIARNILRAMGGDVALTNRPTGGARATVTLPV